MFFTHLTGEWSWSLLLCSRHAHCKIGYGNFTGILLALYKRLGSIYIGEVMVIAVSTCEVRVSNHSHGVVVAILVAL